MNLRRDIKSITYLKNSTADVVEQVSEGRTIVITQNGEAKMVVMGVEEYDRLQDGLALLKLVRRGDTGVRAGRTIPQDEVFRELDAVVAAAKRNRLMSGK